MTLHAFPVRGSLRDTVRHISARAMAKPMLDIPLPRLREVLRTTHGLSQRGLADYLGVSEGTVSRIIKGEIRMLTRERIKKIEAYTGKSYAYLAELDTGPLTEQEVSDLTALRHAPEDLRALLRKNLDPFRRTKP